MTSLRAVVFDLDGTIVDTETAEYESVRRVWAGHGVHLPLARWLPSVGAVAPFDWVAALEAAVGRSLDRAALVAQRRALAAVLGATEPVLPGVVPLLDECRAGGVAVGVASNSPRRWVLGHLERLGLADQVGAVATIDDVARGKPAPDVYLAALRALGVDASAAAAVEDSPPGVAAAMAAGLATVAVPGALARHLPPPPAPLVVRSLADVALADLEALVAARAGSGLAAGPP